MRASQARRAVAVVSIALVALTAAGTRAAHAAPPPAPHDPNQFAMHIAWCTAEPKGCEPNPPPPRPKPKPSSRGGARTVIVTGDVWAALARCESGGNPEAVSASGTYRGAFQFSRATWASVGESGDPAEASYATQLAAAQRLQARSGWGQWPRCSRKLGLR